MPDEQTLEGHLQKQIQAPPGFFWHRVRWRTVAGYLPADRPFELIDYGAGAGMLGLQLAAERQMGTYRFVEPLSSLASHLESVFGADANLNNASDFPNGDYLALLDVLEHQEDDRAFMGALAERMRPGSTLLLTVPALPILWSAWDSELGHYRRYTRPTLRDCVQEAGFEPIEISYLFPEMLPLGLLRRFRHPPGSSLGGRAEFPELGRVPNSILTSIGHLTQRFRRIWPAGTSLFLAATRTADGHTAS
jgi:hypothetical protein